jgi:hypothetical protein
VAGCCELSVECLMTMLLRFAVRMKLTAAYENILIYSYIFICSFWFYCHCDVTEQLYFMKCGELLDFLRNLGLQKELNCRELVS